MKKSKLPPILARKDFDSDEEYAIYQTTENSEWEAVPDDIEVTRSKWQKSAKQTINSKRTRITIAIPDRNLNRIRSLALRRGVPYQTLINEVLQEHLKKTS